MSDALVKTIDALIRGFEAQQRAITFLLDLAGEQLQERAEAGDAKPLDPEALRRQQNEIEELRRLFGEGSE